jgi:alanine transaminase
MPHDDSPLSVGNPQQLGQKGLTFFRQVAALTECPDLIDHELAPQLFPEDARSRAREIIEAIHSVGAYSHSKGIPLVRQHIAEFLERACIRALPMRR